MNLLNRLVDINENIKKISGLGSERERVLKTDYEELSREFQSTREKLNLDIENMRKASRLSVKKLEDLLKKID